MLKRCKCLRYMTLQDLMRQDKSRYVFNADDNTLYPIETLYPFVEYEEETGNPIQVCPYVYLEQNGLVIENGFESFSKKLLNEDEVEILRICVENCESCLSPEKYLFLKERMAEILNMFAKKHNKRIIWKLMKYFIDFLKVKDKYKDDSLCSDVSPSEKKECFDQLWLTSFERYLKNETDYTFP